MALVLSLRKGKKFYVGDEGALFEVTVHKIIDDSHFQLELPDGRVVDVTDDKMVEIAPDVMVGVGTRMEEGLARVAIEAPRHINISREKHVEDAGS